MFLNAKDVHFLKDVATCSPWHRFAGMPGGEIERRPVEMDERQNGNKNSR